MGFVYFYLDLIFVLLSTYVRLPAQNDPDMFATAISYLGACVIFVVLATNSSYQTSCDLCCVLAPTGVHTRGVGEGEAVPN